VYSAQRVPDIDQELQDINDFRRGPDCTDEACDRRTAQEYQDLEGEFDDWVNVRTFTAALASAGVLSAVSGVLLLASIDDEADIDAAASASAGPRLRLGVGVGSLELQGTF